MLVGMGEDRARCSPSVRATSSAPASRSRRPSRPGRSNRGPCGRARGPPNRGVTGQRRLRARRCRRARRGEEQDARRRRRPHEIDDHGRSTREKPEAAPRWPQPWAAEQHAPSRPSVGVRRPGAARWRRRPGPLSAGKGTRQAERQAERPRVRDPPAGPRTKVAGEDGAEGAARCTATPPTSMARPRATASGRVRRERGMGRARGSSCATAADAGAAQAFARASIASVADANRSSQSGCVARENQQSKPLRQERTRRVRPREQRLDGTLGDAEQ